LAPPVSVVCLAVGLSWIVCSTHGERLLPLSLGLSVPHGKVGISPPPRAKGQAHHLSRVSWGNGGGGEKAWQDKAREEKRKEEYLRRQKGKPRKRAKPLLYAIREERMRFENNLTISHSSLSIAKSSLPYYTILELATRASAKGPRRSRSCIESAKRASVLATTDEGRRGAKRNKCSTFAFTSLCVLCLCLR
jgi:hypothetical protein